MKKKTTMKQWYRECRNLCDALINVPGISIELNFAYGKNYKAIRLSIYNLEKEDFIFYTGNDIADYNSEEGNKKIFAEFESIVSQLTNK